MKFKEEHLKSGGILCPACRKGDAIIGGPFDVESGVAFQEVGCARCGASWTDKYQLVEVIGEERKYHES